MGLIGSHSSLGQPLNLSYNDLNKLRFINAPGSHCLNIGSEDWNSTYVRDPYVIKINSSYYMFYSGKGSRSYGIGLAMSKDGYTFRKHSSVPVVNCGECGEWDSFYIQFGSVIKFNKKFLMFYDGGRKENNNWLELGIGIAESDDLISWKKFNGNPIFSTQGNLSKRQLLPFVVKVEDKFFMYTESHKDAGWKIDLSISKTPYYFDEFNTVWSGIKYKQCDVNGVANPKVFVINDGLLMGYNGFDTKVAGFLRLAFSRDGLNWECINKDYPILKGVTAWDAWRRENCFILDDTGSLKLYYFASSNKEDEYKFRIGMAVQE